MGKKSQERPLKARHKEWESEGRDPYEVEPVALLPAELKPIRGKGSSFRGVKKGTSFRKSHTHGREGRRSKSISLQEAKTQMQALMISSILSERVSVKASEEERSSSPDRERSRGHLLPLANIWAVNSIPTI
ncbi:hypothetical protein GOBAR_DD09635 [Gossypium barbadense]|nr:hypothetical protein GOBAR_DD09635 [Gossypium barbadense]